MPENDKALIVNLKTGETKEVDEWEIHDKGMPKDFTVASYVTVEEWIAALRAAYKRC